MEIAFNNLLEIPSSSYSSSVFFFFIALTFTLLCFLFAFQLLFTTSSSSSSSSKKKKKKKKKTCDCVCSCSKTEATTVGGGPYLNNGEDMRERSGSGSVMTDRQSTGASMMEQLVPEITTHALSYLDYPSLCRLSMTNSLMRKAANDDNAWKALYHKDFTLEQDGVRPINGWKAYYATTRAIVNINADFFNIIRERSLQGMSHLWLNADYVKCIHASGELFSGHNAVIQSWQLAFDWQQVVDFQIRDVCARVLTDTAWVTMKAYVDMETGPFNVTNVFEFHNGQWYMVHHHSSVMLIVGEVEQQMFHV